MVLFVCSFPEAKAQIAITEYMYSGLDGEFIELTNISGGPLNMTGWSYSDEAQVPGTVSLSVFGTIAAGESVIISEPPAETFRTAWGLSPTVKILGSNSTNLGRNDEINIYNASSVLVDRLNFGDQEFPGTIRTQNISGWGCNEALNQNMIAQWVLSTAGDAQSPVSSQLGDFGRPGTHTMVSCTPAPTGACCQPSTCTITTEAACTQLGCWQGPATTCSGMCPASSSAQVRITEVMHGGNGAEFIEFTNLSGAPVNMTGWSYSDNSRFNCHVDLSAFGTLANGQSAVLTEATANDFRGDWGLAMSVPVIGGNTVNIGVADEVNLYDSSGALRDRLTYGTDLFPGSPESDGAGIWPCADAVGDNDVVNWRRSKVGDGQGSIASLVGDIGRPGFYTNFNCAPGSCCISGACSVQSLQNCQINGGLFLGDGTNCTGTPCPAPSNANVRITEFMYQSNNAGGEFAEYTNLGNSAVNFAGWSFSDEGIPGVFDLSGIGMVAPGESVIMTDIGAAAFRFEWGLAPSVKVVRIVTSELGPDDTIVLYDNSGSVVDVLNYGAMAYPGTVHTDGTSAWPYSQGVGANEVSLWTLSSPGDAQNSDTSVGGDVGNPGEFSEVEGPFSIPAVSDWGLAIMTLLIVVAATLCLRRQRQAA